MSFRVSPDEYSSLCQACSARGLRSVSELARIALGDVLSGDERSGGIDTKLEDLGVRVKLLTAEIARLSRHVDLPISIAPLSDSKPNA